MTDKNAKTPFDLDLSFLQLEIVRRSLFVVFVVCAGMCVFIALTSGRDFQPDADGLANLALLYRVPFALFTITLPFFALLAANHRSEQTKRQMELTRQQINTTESQNSFSNYYKHNEEFEKRAKGHETETLRLSNPRRFHRLAFPNAKYGSFAVDEAVINTLRDRVEAYIIFLEAFGTELPWQIAAHKAFKFMESVRSAYYIAEKPPGGSEIYAGQDMFVLVGGNIKNFVNNHIETWKFIDEMLQFDAEYKTPKILTLLMTLPLNKFPSTNPDSNTDMSRHFDIRAMLAGSESI